MNDIKNIICEKVSAYAAEKGFELDANSVADFLETPSDSKMGDLALPCFRLSKVFRTRPDLIASELKEVFDGFDGAEKVEAVGGYLNFFFGSGKFVSDLEKLLADGYAYEAGGNVYFDTSKLELTDVSGKTTAFAWKAEDGSIRLSLAEAGVISDTKNVARLTFRAVGGGSTTVSIVTGGLGSEGCGYDERLELTLNPFTDVPAGCWFEKPVLWALDNGITDGTSDTTFSPGNDCLRAHVMTFLWNAEKCPEPAATSSTFTDVPAGSWYEKPVLWAVEKGIPAVVAPTFAVANSMHHMNFPGSMSLRPRTYMECLQEQCRAIAAHGFKRIAIINGHGGNTAAIQAVGNHLYRKGAYLANLNWWLMAGQINPQWAGGHGGGDPLILEDIFLG